MYSILDFSKIAYINKIDIYYSIVNAIYLKNKIDKKFTLIDIKNYYDNNCYIVGICNIDKPIHKNIIKYKDIYMDKDVDICYILDYIYDNIEAGILLSLKDDSVSIIKNIKKIQIKNIEYVSEIIDNCYIELKNLFKFIISLITEISPYSSIYTNVNSVKMNDEINVTSSIIDYNLTFNENTNYKVISFSLENINSTSIKEIRDKSLISFILLNKYMDEYDVFIPLTKKERKHGHT